MIIHRSRLERTWPRVPSLRNPCFFKVATTSVAVMDNTRVANIFRISGSDVEAVKVFADCDEYHDFKSIILDSLSIQRKDKYN